MKKFVLSCAAVVALASVLSSTPAGAVSAIQFTKIYYNSPGTDTRSNTSLNAEYVVVKNKGTTNRSLTGWTIRDYQGHVYKFGTFTLRAGYSVVLHTGKGTNTAANRYWGLTNYVWNNTGYDRATLKNSAGTTQDTCGYTGTSTGYVYC